LDNLNSSNSFNSSPRRKAFFGNKFAPVQRFRYRRRRCNPARSGQSFSGLWGGASPWSHHAVIRVYDEAGNVIETHEHAGDFK
jgi:hypothetical protein